MGLARKIPEMNIDHLDSDYCGDMLTMYYRNDGDGDGYCFYESFVYRRFYVCGLDRECVSSRATINYSLDFLFCFFLFNLRAMFFLRNCIGFVIVWEIFVMKKKEDKTEKRKTNN